MRHGDFSGDYARDQHRGGLSDNYARDGGWSGAGRADDYVRESHRSDEAIREVVNECLTDHDELDATDIEVKVENAEVTLHGVVTSRREKRIAEDVARSCGGVQDVHNRLTIGDREQHIGKASE